MWAGGVQRAGEVVEQLVQCPLHDGGLALGEYRADFLIASPYDEADRFEARAACVSELQADRAPVGCIACSGHDAVGFEAIDVSHQRGSTHVGEPGDVGLVQPRFGGALDVEEHDPLADRRADLGELAVAPGPHDLVGTSDGTGERWIGDSHADRLLP